ncbi:MAG: oligosaccharide flippase family protein [Deltaproteobacteria bacterium]|nr:oligosaccharide flippase family protein [Deltaproteobacteria bacterium]MDL1960228.1 oligosaccharide flippase family protein [Deltaproteobacteria bacterium]
MNLKLFGKNAVIYVIGSIGLRAASFLLIPLYTYSLSISDYGLLITLLLTIQVMIVFMGLGTRTGFMRFAAEYETKNLMGHLLGSSVLINIVGGLILSGVSILFLIPFFQAVLHSGHVSEYIILTCGAAMSQCLCIHILAYYRAKNEGLKFMLASGSAPVLLILMNLVFLLILHQGVKGALMAQIITYGGLWLLVSLNVFSKIGVGISIQLISKLLRFSLPLVFVMSGDLITDASAMYLLSYFGSLEDVAIYSLGYKIAQIAIVAFILPFQLAYEPFIYANINTPGIRLTIAKLLTYLMVGFAFVALIIVFVSRELLSIIAPPEYFSAYLVIFLILPGIAFRGIYYIGESLLYIEKKTYVTGSIVTVFTILSVGLNYLLIPLYGRYGVIVVFNLTLMCTAVLLLILGMKTFPIPLEGKRLVISGILLVLFLLLVFLLRETYAHIFYSIIPLIACFSVVFLYFSSFFDKTEKFAIREIIYRIRGPVRP